MALAKRESMLVWAVGIVVGLFAADHFILTPYLKQREELEAMRGKSIEEQTAALGYRSKEAKSKKEWAQRRDQGLAKDAAEAERQLQGAINQWAHESRVSVASVKPERIESKKDLREIQFVTSAAGDHEALNKFILKIQKAKFPVRITEFQATSRADSSDLTLQMRISTLYLLEDTKDPKKDSNTKVSTTPTPVTSRTTKNVAAKKDKAGGSGHDEF